MKGHVGGRKETGAVDKTLLCVVVFLVGNTAISRNSKVFGIGGVRGYLLMVWAHALVVYMLGVLLA